MTRPHACRRILGLPHATCFKPAGIPLSSIETIQLGLDEVEAVRLADLEGLYQEHAATSMGISRQTFGNILESAHRKIADALVNGKAIIMEGGNVFIEREAANHPAMEPPPDGSESPGCFRRRRRCGRGGHRFGEQNGE